MPKYVKTSYGECQFHIEEEFETLEDARSSYPLSGEKKLYSENESDVKIDDIKIIKSLIKLKDNK